MPRVRTVHTQEEYEEWLGRLEEEEPLPEDYDDFVRTLRGQLQMPDGTYLDYNDVQIAKLWEMKQAEVDYAEHGIRGINIRYPWGVQRRYGVQGLRGLFGWKRVQEIKEAEGW